MRYSPIWVGEFTEPGRRRRGMAGVGYRRRRQHLQPYCTNATGELRERRLEPTVDGDDHHPVADHSVVGDAALALHCGHPRVLI
jgi:hypothetical protein